MAPLVCPPPAQIGPPPPVTASRRFWHPPPLAGPGRDHTLQPRHSCRGSLADVGVGHRQGFYLNGRPDNPALKRGAKMWRPTGAEETQSTTRPPSSATLRPCRGGGMLRRSGRIGQFDTPLPAASGKPNQYERVTSINIPCRVLLIAKLLLTSESAERSSDNRSWCGESSKSSPTR